MTGKAVASLVLISDWSKAGSGFCLYEVCCDCTTKWPTEDTDKDSKGIKQLCCPDEWRLIMAGGRYNSSTESGYSPIEGEMLGIASVLHKCRYFILGHTKMRVVTDHRPIVHFLGDKSRVDY